MRILLRSGLVLLLAASATMAACGGGDERDPAVLETGFEERKGSEWTSLPEEQVFLRELDRASERVKVSEIGRSLQGRPIRLVTVGPPRAREQIAAASSLLFVCAQHGTEPAGREYCLQAAREAVEDVGSNTLLIIPTANPDGLVIDERGNGEGIDTNRDHLELSTPEAKAIAAVMRDYRPDLVGDFHEYKDEGAGEVLLSNPETLHLNVDPSIRDLTGRLHGQAVKSLRAGRFDTDLYPTLDPNANEGVLRQQAALRHSPSLLVETPRRGTLSPLERVAAHRAAAGAMFRMFSERRAELAAATAEARRRAADEEASGRGRYYFESPERYTNRPPCAYRLGEDEYFEVDARLALHGIAATGDEGSWTVSTAQASRPTVGLLLDERAPAEVTEADPVAC